MAGHSMFGTKAVHRHGVLTPDGSIAFEGARVELGALWLEHMGRPWGRPSDGDTMEFLARERERRGSAARFFKRLARKEAKRNGKA